LYGYVWNSPYNFTDPFGFQGSGERLADLLDNKIEKARLGAQGDASNWVWNGAVNTVADLARIGSDALRLGSGIGCALFNDRASTSDKAWAVAADIGRGLTIPGAGIAARMAFRAAKGVGKAASRAARASRGAAKGTGNTLKPLGRGSTGRTTPYNLKEQLAMEEIMSNPASGKVITESLNDPRWRGWTKMSNRHAHGIEIHFNAQFKNGKIINIDDFKFK